MILYHGTSLECGPSIERAGLLEREPGLGIYVSPRRDVALYVIVIRYFRTVSADLAELASSARDGTSDRAETQRRSAVLLARARPSEVHGTLVTLGLPDDFSFRYCDEGMFGYCIPSGHIQRAELTSVEQVSIPPSQWSPPRSRLVPDLTTAERSQYATESRRWVGWPMTAQ